MNKVSERKKAATKKPAANKVVAAQKDVTHKAAARKPVAMPEDASNGDSMSSRSTSSPEEEEKCLELCDDCSQTECVHTTYRGIIDCKEWHRCDDCIDKYLRFLSLQTPS
jgi:hypothetical protein